MRQTGGRNGAADCGGYIILADLMRLEAGLLVSASLPMILDVFQP
jgi:hypothetical protein